jgi:hypothetical protein
MPGNGISGRNGDVLIGSTSVAEIMKWNFNPKSNNPAYASNKTGGYKQRVPGIKDGSGSLDFKLDPVNTIWATMDVGQEMTLNLLIVGTQKYVVPSIVDDLKLSVEIDTGEVVGGTIGFSTNGAWTNPVALVSQPAPLMPMGENVSAPYNPAEAAPGAGPAPMAPAAAQVHESLMGNFRPAGPQVNPQTGLTPEQLQNVASMVAQSVILSLKDHLPGLKAAA